MVATNLQLFLFQVQYFAYDMNFFAGQHAVCGERISMYVVKEAFGERSNGVKANDVNPMMHDKKKSPRKDHR